MPTLRMKARVAGGFLWFIDLSVSSTSCAIALTVALFIAILMSFVDKFQTVVTTANPARQHAKIIAI